VPVGVACDKQTEKRERTSTTIASLSAIENFVPVEAVRTSNQASMKRSVAADVAVPSNRRSGARR